MHLGLDFFQYRIEARITDLKKLNEHIRKLKTRALMSELGIDNIRPDENYEMVAEVKL